LIPDVNHAFTRLADSCRDPANPASMQVVSSVSVDIAVVLGQTVMPIHQLLRMGRGAVIELDTTEEEDVMVLANGHPVATAKVSVSGNRIAVEVTALLKKPETLAA
jgi:flagellar motor switch protein FliN